MTVQTCAGGFQRRIKAEATSAVETSTYPDSHASRPGVGNTRCIQASSDCLFFSNLVNNPRKTNHLLPPTTDFHHTWKSSPPCRGPAGRRELWSCGSPKSSPEQSSCSLSPPDFCPSSSSKPRNLKGEADRCFRVHRRPSQRNRRTSCCQNHNTFIRFTDRGDGLWF